MNGCVYGSLASNTGFSSGGVWSVAKVQDVHVGETVRFSFVLRERFRDGRIELLGIADYAAANILDERIEVEPDVSSAFLFENKLKDVPAGRIVDVEVAAFKIRGTRDYMKIRGRWQHSISAVDEPDNLVGQDRLRLRVYQSEIDYSFAKPRADLDWATARLVLTRDDGRASTVLMDQPHRPGFTMNGPDRKGNYHIQYFPLAEQINSSGSTRASLKVLDVHGVQQSFEFDFETP